MDKRWKNLIFIGVMFLILLVLYFFGNQMISLIVSSNQNLNNYSKETAYTDLQVLFLMNDVNLQKVQNESLIVVPGDSKYYWNVDKTKLIKLNSDFDLFLVEIEKNLDVNDYLEVKDLVDLYKNKIDYFLSYDDLINYFSVFSENELPGKCSNILLINELESKTSSLINKSYFLLSSNLAYSFSIGSDKLVLNPDSIDNLDELNFLMDSIKQDKLDCGEL